MTEAATTPTVRVSLVAVAIVLLAVTVAFEVLAGPTLRAPHQAQHQAQVLAISGVGAMIGNTGVDPSELRQVASSQHQPIPLALPAEALLDGLLLVGIVAVGVPRLLHRRRLAGAARLGVFVVSLAVLVGGIAVAVNAIARLRLFVALYLSPPLGTLSYLLLYGSFRRDGGLVALTVLMALKLGVLAILWSAYPRALVARGMAALAVTSVGATVVTAICYALVPATLASITDALAAAIISAAAIAWAGIIVSGSVRRLA